MADAVHLIWTVVFLIPVIGISTIILGAASLLSTLCLLTLAVQGELARRSRRRAEAHLEEAARHLRASRSRQTTVSGPAPQIKATRSSETTLSRRGPGPRWTYKGGEDDGGGGDAP